MKKESPGDRRRRRFESDFIDRASSLLIVRLISISDAIFRDQIDLFESFYFTRTFL